MVINMKLTNYISEKATAKHIKKAPGTRINTGFPGLFRFWRRHPDSDWG